MTILNFAYLALRLFCQNSLTPAIDKGTVMSRKKTVIKILLLIASILAGGFTSAMAAQWLITGGAGIFNLAFLLGAFFGGLGWSMAETMVENVVFLVITTVLAGVAFIFLQSEMLRTVVIAFLCGFNIGKITGTIYREFWRD